VRREKQPPQLSHSSTVEALGCRLSLLTLEIKKRRKQISLTWNNSFKYKILSSEFITSLKNVQVIISVFRAFVIVYFITGRFGTTTTGRLDPMPNSVPLLPIHGSMHVPPVGADPARSNQHHHIVILYYLINP